MLNIDLRNSKLIQKQTTAMKRFPKMSKNNKIELRGTSDIELDNNNFQTRIEKLIQIELNYFKIEIVYQI